MTTEYHDGDAPTQGPFGVPAVWNDEGTMRVASAEHPLPVDCAITIGDEVTAYVEPGDDPLVVEVAAPIDVTPQATENHLGQVSGHSDVVVATPTIDTNAYTAGDAVGGKQTLAAARASGKQVILQSLTVLDLGNAKAPLTILFFDADPTNATITNNLAFAWSSDTDKFIGKINVAAADYETVAGEAVATLKGIGLVLEPSGSANIYAVVVTTGTPTYTGTSDLVFRYGFLQD